MALVAGIDSSTQSCKVVVVDAETGTVHGQGAATHPDTTEVDPEAWWEAFRLASADADGWSKIEAVSVAAQQHGLVAVDEAGAAVRPALLWNDMRSGNEARALVEEYGPQAWADAVGSVPVPSFTVTKLAWLAAHEPSRAERVAQVMLPHDWLTWRLLDCPKEPVTDRSDASGTGYWSPRDGRYRTDLLARALGREVRIPRVLGATELAGRTASGVLVGPGAGDNAAAALCLSAGMGDVIVSVGTSGTVFAVADHATSDASGAVAGFADATGRFLPLVCTLSATRVLAATAALLGVDHAGLDRLASGAPLDADGLVFVPYLDGERTPNLPDATGTLLGMRRATMTPEHLARAAALAVLCGLADGLDELRANGVSPRRILLIGGGARSAALREAAASVFGLPVSVPEPAEYVALGAARQAAWVLSGSAEPPAWASGGTSQYAVSGDWGAQVRDQYRDARDRVYSDGLAAG